MPEGKKLRFGKRKYLYGLLFLSFVSLIGVAFSITGSDDLEFARREILLRRIGHEILLQSGDSTSRVLPVKKIGNNEYQISFENAVGFQPTQLIHTTRGVLSQDPLITSYVVNVLNCADGSVAYGYAIASNQKDDIISCVGRVQPKACYLVNIQFQTTSNIPARTKYMMGALLLLALGGGIGWKVLQQRKPVPELSATPELPVVPESSVAPEQSAAPELPVVPEIAAAAPADQFTLGTIAFDAERRTLTTDDTTIDLTHTETRVLRMFALSPNAIIERSRLQKEIWEDEGVIVGRSLDMFISKLRKKLECDPMVKIVVIRGKGYKLHLGA